MTYYLIRRLFQMAIVVFLSTIAIYILLNIAPGGPLAGLNLLPPQQKPTKAQKARMEAYLGLDKPLALRYITWLLGDDWLGADWVYVGLTPFKQDKIGAKGNPIFKTNRDTGEKTIVQETFRFWADPGVALVEPNYMLWVWGEETSPETYTATAIRVKPASTEERPEDVIVWGVVLEQEGLTIIIEDLNGNNYTLNTSVETAYTFPPGEGKPRPEEGDWLNISWLTSPAGILAKYASYRGNGHGLLRLDFGTSWNTHLPVIDMIGSRLSNTLILMTSAVVLSLLIAIPIGIYSAIHQYSKLDYAVTTFAFFGSAMPVFWFGLMMILIFSYVFKNMDWPFLPSGGIQMVRTAPSGSLLAALKTQPGSLVDRIVHLFMPVTVLSLLYMAGWSRFMRTSMLEVLRQDYVRTARAKGLTERLVIVKHAVRNAMIPIITIVVFQIPGIFGGAILTETIFSYPGMGRLYFDALGANDWPVVMVLLFITSVLVVVATLVRDVLYTFVDPRIRFN